MAKKEFKIIDGAYRVKESEASTLKQYLIDLMTKSEIRTDSGQLSKKALPTTKIFVDGNQVVFKNKNSNWSFDVGETFKATIQRRNEAIEYASDESKKIAAKWKRDNITDWNRGRKNKKGLWIQKPTNPTGKPLKETDPLFRRWEHKVKVTDPFWKSFEGLDLPYKSGDVENLTWTNPEQWKLKDAGERTYGSKYLFDVDHYTGDIEYTPRKGFNPHTSIFKKFTGVIDHTSNLIPTPVKKVAKGAAATGIVGLGLIDDVSASVKPFVTDYDGDEEQRKLDRIKAAAGWTGLYATATGNIPAASMSMLSWSTATYKAWALGRDKGRIDDLELSLGLKSSDRDRLEPDVLGQGDTQKLTRRGSR